MKEGQLNISSTHSSEALEEEGEISKVRRLESEKKEKDALSLLDIDKLKAKLQETGVRFNNLDFKEQGWFLMYCKNADNDKKEDLFEHVRRYGEKGLKLFLSLEFGEDNGDTILSIGEKLKDQPEIADRLFSEYVRMVDSVEQIVEEASEMYKEIFPDK